MSRRRNLRPEEAELWHAVARTARAMHPRSALVHKPDTEPSRPLTEPAPEKPAPKLNRFRVGERSGTRTGHDTLPNLSDGLARAPVLMDSKSHAKMIRGKLEPEARIDLHGMTLAVAQPVLIRFVLQAQAAGKRLVLVITGKGREGGPDAPLPVRPGALRHNVPHWLHMPPLNAIVLQVRPAHRRHGGEGAYYVYLRR